MDEATLRKALRALGPNGNRQYIDELSSVARDILDDYKINTPLRLSHFWSQISHECAGFKTFQESLNYSVDGLLKTFSRKRISEVEAARYGRIPGRPADQKAIANIVYGGDFGRKQLGNTQPGDGWEFIGRGPKQITGRANYTEMARKLGIDLVDHPELMLRPDVGLKAACEFWVSRGLNSLADKNDIVAITKKINGGTLGLANRRANFVIAWRIFGKGDELPESGRTVASSSEATTTAAAAGGGGLGIYGAYEVGKEAVRNASEIKESAEGAGSLLGVSGSTAILVGGLIILVLGMGFLLYRNWRRKDEEDSE